MADTSAIEASAATLTSKVTVTSGSASFLGFVAKVDVIAWGGLAIAALGLLIQLYFAIQKNKREKRDAELREIEHEQRMANLKGECRVEQD
ncbi:holin [Acinetobacter sp. S40]|uniref:holin n=1 Tax=Acinetobacter sp. S40 TaxID=2767434 RepID=UPI00190B87C1|nr:holin [Acinetobacter sp. S40]MBJ9984418.1 holin [Acinetobacter sp. S40]